MKLIGVDPGASETGIVLRDGDTLEAHLVVARGNLPTGPYVRTVLDRIEALDCGVLAVEGVRHPTPHMGLTNVRGLLGTAQVLGAVLGRYRHAVVVDPAKHGSGPLAAYPPALRPSRGRGQGKDRLRHCRAAWDVAGAARTLLRMQERSVR